jgi:hypothetical protein
MNDNGHCEEKLHEGCFDCFVLTFCDVYFAKEPSEFSLVECGCASGCATMFRRLTTIAIIERFDLFTSNAY